MPIVSKSEFARMCGVNAAAITYQCKTGGLFLKDGKIDTENETNAAYLNTKLYEANRPEPEPVDVKLPQGMLNSNLSEMQLAKLKKQLEVEKLQKEIEEKQIKIDKAQGVLIPVDAVQSIMVILSKSIVMEFNDAAKSFITASPKLTAKEAADLKAKLIGIINKSSKSAIGKAKRDLDKVIEEYSQIRGVGERT